MKYNYWENTYWFKVCDYNLIDKVYQNIKEDDRIIFVVRHAERWRDFSHKWGLVESGIEQAKKLWKRLQGWRFSDTTSDFYWSTAFRRTVETSYYIGQARWYPWFTAQELSDWDNFDWVYHPIKVVDYDYYRKFRIEDRYKEHKELWKEKSLALVATLCELTENHPFSWITTHDMIVVPFLCRLTDLKLSFTKETWINYLSWFAIIIHQDWLYELYPIRSLKEKTMALFE